MAWVRIDDCFDEHPKLQKVGPIGWGYWLAGLAYCNRNLTDGFIPWAKSQTLASFVVMEHDQKLSKLCHSSGMVGDDIDANWVIGLLLEAGLWEDVDGGYLVHDYADYQPTREQIEAEREITRKRVEAHRNKKNGQFGNGKVTPLQQEYNDSTNSVVTPAPNPSPIPIRKESDKSLSHPEFDEEFWPEYPKKEAKKAARAAWVKLNPDRELIDVTVADVRRRKTSPQWTKNNGEFIPNPASYLNGRRWEDEQMPERDENTLDDGTPCKPGLVRHSLYNTCCEPHLREWVG